MRSFLFIFYLINFSYVVCSQNKIILTATINDIFCGQMTEEDFFNSRQLELNDTSYKINSYELSFWVKGGYLKELKVESEIISNEIKDSIRNISKNNTLFFHSIKCFNSKGDSLIVNPIIINFAENKREKKTIRNCDFARTNIKNIYDGRIDYDSLMNLNKISIFPKNTSLTIKRFGLEVTGVSIYAGFPIVSTSDSINSRMKQLLKGTIVGTKIFVYDIIAIDDELNEFMMNPLWIEID